MIWRNLILSSRVAYPVYASSEFTVYDVHTWDDVDGWRLLKKLKIAEWKNKTAFCLHKIFSNLISTLVAHNMRQFFHTLKSQKKRVQICGLWLFQSCKSMIIYHRRVVQRKNVFSMSALIFIKNQFQAYSCWHSSHSSRVEKREKRRRYRRGEHIKKSHKSDSHRHRFSPDNVTWAHSITHERKSQPENIYAPT